MLEASYRVDLAVTEEPAALDCFLVVARHRGQVGGNLRQLLLGVAHPGGVVSQAGLRIRNRTGRAPLSRLPQRFHSSRQSSHCQISPSERIVPGMGARPGRQSRYWYGQP
jgi:hypothetical protein